MLDTFYIAELLGPKILKNSNIYNLKIKKNWVAHIFVSICFVCNCSCRKKNLLFLILGEEVCPCFTPHCPTFFCMCAKCAGPRPFPS